MRGYAHPLYAQSLAEFGTPRELPHSGGWVLERGIPQSSWSDATSCYPLFSCRNWAGLTADCDSLRNWAVTLALVPDPFGCYTVDDLRRSFDVVTPFKHHRVIELGSGSAGGISKHHRYYARQALREVRIERASEPSAAIDEWLDLYANLVKRHQLRGIKAFSRKAFEMQLRVPGIVMLRALHEGQVVGAHLWYDQGDSAYSHLMALNDTGYVLNASYALYWEAITRAGEFFPAARRLDLGAGAGVESENPDGLSQFKRGWSSMTCPAYFCGRILNQNRYDVLVNTRRLGGAAYFPAYRQGEF